MMSTAQKTIQLSSDDDATPAEPDARPICRVRSLTGLARRQMPHHCGVIPQPMIYWSAAIRTGGFRSTAELPPIYWFEAGEDPRLIVPTASNAHQVAACRRRLRVAERHNIETGDGVAAPQCALRPRHLYTLGHLIASLKYAHVGSHVIADPACKDRPAMLLEPARFVERLGYAISGDAYAYLESDLRELARFLIIQEERIDGAWRTVVSEPLLRYFDSGRVRVANGIEQSISTRRSAEDAERPKCAPRRLPSWHISLGNGLLAMLQSQPSDLSVISPALWDSAGRSPVSQWLAVYFSGHGYDGGEIYRHRLDTLMERMRLCPDSVLRFMDEQDVNALEAARDQWAPSKTRNALQVEPGAERQSWKATSMRGRDIHRLRQRLWRQIASAGNRIQARLGLAVFAIEQRAGTDLSASQRKSLLSGGDHLNIRRWSAEIERIAQHIPHWFSQRYADLLNWADRTVLVARETIGQWLTKLASAPEGSWLARHALHRLHALRSISEIGLSPNRPREPIAFLPRPHEASPPPILVL